MTCDGQGAVFVYDGIETICIPQICSGTCKRRAMRYLNDSFILLYTALNSKKLKARESPQMLIIHRWRDDVVRTSLLCLLNSD